MISIRPIERHECSQFLKILCTVFDLDFQRAEGVFYEEPHFDLARKWALYDSDQMVSILTTTPLQFGSIRAMGIAGVATIPSKRNQGLANHLVNHVLEHGATIGESRALLFAQRTNLYESCGFTIIDHVVKGEIRTSLDYLDKDRLEFDSVRAKYQGWCSIHPSFLVRSPKGWEAWKWNFKVCEAVDEGYVCFEANTIREMVTCPGQESWPVGPNCEWYGLKAVTELLQVPADVHPTGLMLLGHSIDFTPLMFMTDQF